MFDTKVKEQPPTPDQLELPPDSAALEAAVEMLEPEEQALVAEIKALGG